MSRRTRKTVKTQPANQDHQTTGIASGSLKFPHTQDWRRAEKETLSQERHGDFPLVVPDAFQIIAHRGASGYAPDHSLEAFKIAQRLGAAHIEIDAQVSKDGVVVLCHDKTLDAYGHPGRVIRAMNYVGELDHLDMVHWGKWKESKLTDTQMMTLDTLMSEFGRSFTYHIELKSGQNHLTAEVLKVVDNHNMRDNVIFTSATPTMLAMSKELAPEIPRAYLVRYVEDRVMTIAKRLAVTQLCPRADTITPELVSKIKESGIPQVRAWGVSWLTKNHGHYKWRTNQVIESGCDGTTIDHPDYLIPESKAAARKEAAPPL
jgi:glycerophosphoryl diester phosphodiesterase